MRPRFPVVFAVDLQGKVGSNSVAFSQAAAWVCYSDKADNRSAAILLLQQTVDFGS